MNRSSDQINLDLPELESFYNLSEQQTVFVTMDVDWAPDEVLDFTFEWFVREKIAITAFLTHRSESALNFASESLVEIGLHPDLSRPGDPDSKVQTLKSFYPMARGARGHRNVAGRLLLDALHSSGLNYDASKLLWNLPSARVTIAYNGLFEVPYVWEDGVHLEMNLPLHQASMPLSSPGLRVLNIHPMLFFLNSQSEIHRKSVTDRYSDLTSAPFEELESERNREVGVGSLFRDVLLQLRSSGARFLRLWDMLGVAEPDENTRVTRRVR